MGNFLGRLRELAYYTDTESLEIMGGIFRLLAMWHMGYSPSSLFLALTGVGSIVSAWSGRLSWRNLFNLVGVTVPAALIVTNLVGLHTHCQPEALFTLITSLWCLIRTMKEIHSRGTK